jgi:hypothetical protein
LIYSDTVDIYLFIKYDTDDIHVGTGHFYVFTWLDKNKMLFILPNLLIVDIYLLFHSCKYNIHLLTRIQIQGVLHCFFFFNYFPLCLFYTKIVFFLFSCAIATECNNKKIVRSPVILLLPLCSLLITIITRMAMIIKLW